MSTLGTFLGSNYEGDKTFTAKKGDVNFPFKHCRGMAEVHYNGHILGKGDFTTDGTYICLTKPVSKDGDEIRIIGKIRSRSDVVGEMLADWSAANDHIAKRQMLSSFRMNENKQILHSTWNRIQQRAGELSMDSDPNAKLFNSSNVCHTINAGFYIITASVSCDAISNAGESDGTICISRDRSGDNGDTPQDVLQAVTPSPSRVEGFTGGALSWTGYLEGGIDITLHYYCTVRSLSNGSLQNGMVRSANPFQGGMSITYLGNN